MDKEILITVVDKHHRLPTSAALNHSTLLPSESGMDSTRRRFWQPCVHSSIAHVRVHPCASSLFVTVSFQMLTLPDPPPQASLGVVSGDSDSGSA
eukprot:3491364-Rhodomonas_salina.1